MPHSIGSVLVLHENPQTLSEWSTITPLFGISSRLCNTVGDALTALSSESFAALVTADHVGGDSCIPVVRAARANTPAAEVMVLTHDPESMQRLLRELSISAEVLSQSMGSSDLVARLIISHGRFHEK